MDFDERQQKHARQTWGRRSFQTERERPGAARHLWGDSMEAERGWRGEFKSDNAGQDARKAV